MAYFTASCDPPETNKAFAESLALDYPVLSDPDRKVARAYRVVAGKRAVPFRWTYYIGGDGRILHIDKQVNPRTSGRDVVRQLAALGVARKRT